MIVATPTLNDGGENSSCQRARTRVITSGAKRFTTSMKVKLGSVRELWRYPVMGLQGEPLQKAEIRESGVVGDHRYVFQHLEGGRVIDPVTYAHHWGETLAYPSMLDLGARFASDSRRIEVTTPGGMRINSADPSFERQVRDTIGLPVRLLEFPQAAETRRRAGRALHLITSASLERLKELNPRSDFDLRRFRPNVVVGSPSGKNGFVEESWVGEEVRIGSEVVVRVEKPNTRCKVTTMKQGDLPFDEKILETISRNNDNVLGVMCSVVKGGYTAVGDDLELISASENVVA